MFVVRQTAALVAVTNVSEYLDETSIRRMVLPKIKTVYEKNAGDLKIVANILSCIEKTLDRLERPQIIDEVLPLLWDVRLQDPDIILRVVSKCAATVFAGQPLDQELTTCSSLDIYKLMLTDIRHDLSENLESVRNISTTTDCYSSLNLDQLSIICIQLKSWFLFRYLQTDAD